MSRYVLKLSPYVSETIWGGRKLIDEYNIKTEKSNAAEGWMLSCHPDGSSVVVNGEYAGKSLPDVLENNRQWCGTNALKFDRFPVLIKFIDAMDDLSVQVHPTDEYCKKTGRGESKTECWYIIDAAPDASLILGFKDKISRETFEKAIIDGNLTDYTSEVKVHPGDFFFIESGTLHAICKGVLLAEVQESSNTTYRIFDYNRTGKDGKPRELHIADAVEVTKLEKYSQPVIRENNNGKIKLADCDLFKVWINKTDSVYSDSAREDSFVSLLIISGEGILTVEGKEYSFNKGDSLFIPAGSGEYTIKGKAEILETRI